MMKTRSRTALPAPLIAILLLALGTAAGSAQTSATGAIAGVVSDATGAPLPDALVTLAGSDGGGVRSAMTDDRGRFRFSFLAPADYTLSSELLGFAPTHTTEIPVRPGRDVQLEVVLDAVAEASPEPVTRRFDGAALRTGRAGAGQWLPLRQTLPAERRELRDAARLSSWSDEALGFEGQPAAGALLVDGTPFRPARHPALGAGSAPATGFALGAFESALAAPAPFTLDLPTGSAGFLAAHTLPGASSTRLGAELRWSGDVLPGSVDEGDVPSYNELHGAVTLRGGAAESGARYAAGLSIRSIERPYSSAWTLDETTSALLGEAAERGAPVTGYAAPRALTDRALSGFGSVDLPVGERHTLAVSAHFASLPRLESIDPRSGLVASLEGTDLLGSLVLRSAFGSVDNELRAAVTSSTRESLEPDPLPATFFVGQALGLGRADGSGRASESTVQLRDALRFRAGGLDLTLGADVLLASHEIQRGPFEEVFFGGLAQLQAGTGVRRRYEGGPPVAEWSQPLYAVFGEARMLPLPGLSLRVGVRAERESLPSDEVSVDTTWTRLSPVSNAAAKGDGWRVGPQLGLSWDIDRQHRWLLDLDAGIHHDRYDPLMLAAWQQLNGTARVRRTVGTLDWPAGTPASEWTSNRLFFLEPGFEPVRTARIGGGLTHHLADGTALQLAAVLRKTENLPRRNSLNVRSQRDFRECLRAGEGGDCLQFGRDVYGTLVHQGALLTGEPGSANPLDEYDDISVIESFAEADYWGITVGLERDVARGLSVLARYTFSRTTDDWFGARELGWRALAPRGLGDAGWANGTSDFDVPHRLAAGLSFDLDPVAPVALSALVRVESGLPFTPGFRYGVDANGDGDAGNDPAFIDPQLPGMAELMAEWPCLAESSGRFAERNGCRAEPLKALDLSAEARLLRFGAVQAGLIVEAFNVLDAGREVPDAALYLVDPEGELVIDTVADFVTVPLLVNESFGSRLTRRDPGRRVRLGVSLTW